MNITRSIALCLSLSAFGCAAVTTQTSSTTPTLVVEVPNQPPEAKAEVKSPCPSPGSIWVAGYWDYIDGHHVWRDGRWVSGKSGYEYVRAQYVYDGHAWQFHVPHWHKRPVTDSPQMAAAATQGSTAEGK